VLLGLFSLVMLFAYKPDDTSSVRLCSGGLVVVVGTGGEVLRVTCAHRHDKSPAGILWND
jgi:hypothetical protein